MKLAVTLNGKRRNPWKPYGLTQNPFPQIAKAQLMPAMMQLNSLDAEPIREDYRADIRQRLQGWSEEFIQLCIRHFIRGERATFYVEVKEEWL